MRATRSRLLLGVPVLAAAILASVWFDLLPGGWTLRGWVSPHYARRDRLQAEHRAQRLEAFEGENSLAPAGALVFLGSSTIERFPLGRLFEGTLCLNRGIGNEDLAGLLGRLDRSLPTAPAAGAVIYAGSIDFRVHQLPAVEIRRRVAVLVKRLRAELPELPLALIGILPDRDMDPGTIARLRDTNRALRELCAGWSLSFVDTDRAPITDAQGSLEAASSADDLHLNEAGYRALARWIREEGGKVGRMLGPESGD